MSPLLITILTVSGIAVILVAISYINHMAENNKLEKIRLKAELNDRMRRCAQISEGLPGQFISPALKLLLSRIELNLSEQQLILDKKDAGNLQERIKKTPVISRNV